LGIVDAEFTKAMALYMISAWNSLPRHATLIEPKYAAINNNGPAEKKIKFTNALKLDIM
jgi:hypothetical protein